MIIVPGNFRKRITVINVCVCMLNPIILSFITSEEERDLQRSHTSVIVSIPRLQPSLYSTLLA